MSRDTKHRHTKLAIHWWLDEQRCIIWSAGQVSRFLKSLKQRRALIADDCVMLPQQASLVIAVYSLHAVADTDAVVVTDQCLLFDHSASIARGLCC